MTKEYVYLQGKAKWANRLARPDEKFNRWSVVLYPNAESLEKFKALGTKNVVKKDDDGYNITLSRPVNKMMRGKLIAFTPPEVIDKDKQPLTAAIGNGSDVTVKIEAYSYTPPTGGKAKAIRLESVRVDNLIPFEPDTDYPDPAQTEAVAGLKDQPEQLF